MELKIGDCVKYEEKDINGEEIKGKIIAIAKNTIDVVSTYLVVLISGQYTQFTSDDVKWCKLVEPVLQRKVIRTSPLILPVVLSAHPCPYNDEDYNGNFPLLISVN